MRKKILCLLIALFSFNIIVKADEAMYCAYQKKDNKNIIAEIVFRPEKKHIKYNVEILEKIDAGIEIAVFAESGIVNNMNNCPNINIDLNTYKIQFNSEISNFNIVYNDGKPKNSCLEYFEQDECQANNCVWNENKNNPYESYCNTDKLKYVACGDSYDIPAEVPSIMSFIINFLKVLIPILLIIMSVISLVKAIGASKEDEIKKAQSTLVRRLIACVLAFLVITIVQFVLSKVADDDEYNSMTNCLSCFLNNDCDAYYRTYVEGDYVCHLVKNSLEQPCPETKEEKSFGDLFKDIKESIPFTNKNQD